ncbi:hypothetical protein D3P07_00665 [Paenibacillus sp. 1011MAR3C5]|uniref:hypothetical protein n=1 Tax=Paenibacillus sp. 1011MAR3C5 TaxID=1675787 RepID=UPI000E6CDEC8|nr:hypothetical protein [Paenibacillus sp. 1011MAR3C5]RJE90656.1 hypothetical protein D3P07_00665 [Paenibacillus sp. 1011MAR3C5]
MSIQEIGFVIDLTKGTFVNTMNKDGKLQLAEIGLDANNKVIYAEQGYWESTPIVIQDKIKAFSKLVKSVSIAGNASFKNYVRISDDGYVWGDYIEVGANNTVTNDSTKKYAMIKIEIFGGEGDVEILIDDFLQAGVYDTDFVDGSNGLSLIKDKKNIMVEDTSHMGNGKIFTHSVVKADFKKINRIRVNAKK